MKGKSAPRARRSALRVTHPEEAAPPAFAREDLLAARFKVARVLPYQRSSTPFISNLSLAIFSGFLMVFAFPDWNLWSLGWVGTAPLIMAVVREQRFWRSFMLGSVTGTIFYMGSSYWVTHSMHNYGEIPLALCYLILTIFSLTLGVFTGLFAAVLALVVKRFGGWAILSAPVIWAACEWARLEVTGMGWNALGYSQAFQLPVIQIARWGGVYLVSAMLVSASTALVFGLIYLERRRGFIVLTAAIVLTIAAVIYGQSLRLDEAERGSVFVSAIQPNIQIEGRWDDPRFVSQMIAHHISLSEQAIRANSKQAKAMAAGAMLPVAAVDSKADGAKADGAKAGDLVIWPESPMNFQYDRDRELQRRVAEFTRRNNVYLLMNTWGYPNESVSDDIIYNSAIAIAPSGDKIARYDKIALVPFGEYVPARNWVPFMDRIPALVGDITPGTSFTLSDVAGARLGALICFEATRPDIARRFRSEGASALVQISNELWFGPTSAARQMLAHAVFRAVENNIDLIRATNSGLSARIDSYGAAYDETPMFETAVRTWRVKTADEARADPITFYTRFGDLFVTACAAAGLLLLVAALVPKKEIEP